MLPADRLDHLDRDELVVAAAQVAVVLQQDLDAVAQPGRPHRRDRVLVLRARDRRRRDAAAVAAGGVEREAAPAGADLQHVVVGTEVERAADPLELRDRRLVQRRVGVLEDPGRVHHRLVEEAREQLVAEVVVGGDPLARAGARVRPQPPRRPLHRADQRQQPLAGAVAGLHRPRRDPHERDEVVARPQPVHVGSGRARRRDAAPARRRPPAHGPRREPAAAAPAAAPARRRRAASRRARAARSRRRAPVAAARGRRPAPPARAPSSDRPPPG